MALGNWLVNLLEPQFSFCVELKMSPLGMAWAWIHWPYSFHPTPFLSLFSSPPVCCYSPPSRTSLQMPLHTPYLVILEVC